MNAIHIIRKLESDNIPELKPWIGSLVEIIIRDPAETHASHVLPGTGDWEAARQAVEALEDYDFDAVEALNEAELRDSLRRVP